MVVLQIFWRKKLIHFTLIMIKWKLNVILFILLKGNSYIVCITIFLLWTYRYRGFKIFERYRQPTLEKYAAVTILRGCKLWSNNIRVRINYYCWSLWGAEGLGLPVFNQLCWIAAYCFYLQVSTNCFFGELYDLSE